MGKSTLMRLAAASLASIGTVSALGPRLVQPSSQLDSQLTRLHKRAECGPDIGACDAARCCSKWGWCGIGDDYCGSGCQPGFGRLCDSEGGGGIPEPEEPVGSEEPILAVPRPKFGSIPYGVRIDNCATKGTIAITYDDGPFLYTAQLLDLLAAHNATSTFFVNGLNFGNTREAPYPSILRRMVAEGHQVASHGYTHDSLDALTAAGRRKLMALNEKLINDTLGYFPTYMRPPFGFCGTACQAEMANLGYHVIIWNLDTLDYANNSPSTINDSKVIFDSAVNFDASKNAYISLEHDVHETTVRSLTEHILQTAQSRGYRTVTVGECLGDAPGNWYRNGTTGEPIGDDPNPNPGNGGGGNGGGDNGGGNGGGGSDEILPSPDGSCGARDGGRFTCLGSWAGPCCSRFGWCGTAELGYCGDGCQAEYGECGKSGKA